MTRIWRTALKRFVWILPTLAVGLAASRWMPIAAPATLLLLCYLPGQLVVRLTKLGEDWDIAGRALLSIAFSLAVTPVLLNPVWHVTNNPWALLAYVWVLLQTSWWLSRRSARARPSGQDRPVPELRLFDHRSTKLLCAALAGLVAFATIGPYWPTELKGYPVPALIHDFIKHHAVLFSLG